MKHLHLVFERQSTAIYEFILYHVSKQYVYGDFPSQFYFLFLEQNIKWLQSFLSERKSFARTRKRSFFSPPFIFIRSNYFVKLFWPHKGSSLCCVNWLIQIYWENLYSQKPLSHQIASEAKIPGGLPESMLCVPKVSNVIL